MHVSGAHNGNTIPCTLSFQFQLFASRIAKRVGGGKHTNGGESKWKPCPTSFLHPYACSSLQVWGVYLEFLIPILCTEKITSISYFQMKNIPKIYVFFKETKSYIPLN